jgi:hypothetical protein
MTEPPKMTETEIVALVAEAVSWVTQMREQYRPVATPLDEPQKTKMRPFFPTDEPDSHECATASVCGNFGRQVTVSVDLLPLRRSFSDGSTPRTAAAPPSMIVLPSTRPLNSP